MRLGDLSAKYESNGDPGTVSTGWGDAGGVSYGAYQFASNAGVPADFVAWLVRNCYKHAYILIQAGTPGREEFNAAWQYVADLDPDGFLAMQHEFTKQRYYDEAVKLLASAGYHVQNHSEAMQQVVWSRSVQYGAGNIVEMFEAAAAILGYPNLSYVDAKNFDADMIRTIYLDVCRTPEWTNASPDLRYGLYQRFESECRDALARLA